MTSQKHIHHIYRCITCGRISESSLRGEPTDTPSLSKPVIIGKLRHMMEVDGSQNLLKMLCKYSNESEVIGICADPSCDYIGIVSPHEEYARCMACRANTVISLFKLAEKL